MPNLKVDRLTASDKPRINSYSSGVYGIQPSFFDVTTEDFLKMYYENYTDTSLGYAEQMYTARGSQGAATGTIILEKTQTDPSYAENFNSYFLMNVYG